MQYYNDEFTGLSDNGLLNSLILTSPVGIAVIDAVTQNIEMLNDVYLSVAGKSYAEVYGKPVWETFAEAAPIYAPLMQRAIDEGIPAKGEETELTLTRNGREETFFVNFVYNPVKDASGKVIKVSVWVIENTLQAKERRVVQQLNEELTATNEELYVSNEELKQSENEVLKLNSELEIRVEERTQELAVANEELTVMNEELVQTQQTLQLLNDKLEESVAARTKQLQKSESRLRSVFEQAPLAFSILHGKDLVIEFANPRMLALWNATTDVIGKPHHQTRPDTDETAGFLAILDNVFATGIAYSVQEVRAFTAVGNVKEWGYFSFTYQPVKDEEGKTSDILVIVDDVTEAVEARQENQRTNEQLRTAFAAARLGSWYIHPQTKALEYNDSLAGIFGYEGKERMTYDDAIGQVTEEYREKIVHEIEKAIADGGDYDITYSQRRFNDGKLIWLRSLGKISQDESGANSVFAGVVMDITEQVNLLANEQALNEELATTNEELQTTNEELIQAQNNYIEATVQSEKDRTELAFAIAAAGLGTFDLTLATSTFAINDLLAAWSGTPPGEDLDLERAVGTVAEYDQARLMQAVQEASRLETGGVLDVEYTIINKQNLVPRIVRARGQMFFDDDRMPLRLSGVVADITEQRRDDQRKNDFIGMVSHEMKTPLTSLSGYLQLLRLNTGAEDGFATSMLDKSNKQISKITTLINGFLNVSRLESGKIQIDKQRFDMAVLVKEAEEETMAMYNSHRIVFAPVGETFVTADRDKIGQVINNLISNAVKYSPLNTRIVVACVTVDGCAIVSVKDEGIGVKEEDEAKLFERYYRVNNDNAASVSGFGIGLYLCAEIIKRHEGKIWVESEVGKGSTFLFTLPLGE